MEVKTVYMVRDSVDHDIMFITTDKDEAQRVHDWFEANTKQMYNTSRKSWFNVKEYEVYTSPLDREVNSYIVNVTVWGVQNGEDRVTYQITPRSLTFSSVTAKHQAETWRERVTHRYSMTVAATSLEDAKAKANTLLEPFGVVLP